MRIFGAVALSLLLSACSTPTAKPLVQLYPNANVESSSIGNQQLVYVSATDARDLSSYSTANINPAQNVPKILTREISQGLKNQGFKTVTTPAGKEDQISIKLVTLDYRALSGMASNQTETSAKAEVTATKPSGTVYKKVYTASATNQSVLGISSQTPSSQVNQALDKLLNNILNDSSLTQFLVKN
ncbi:MAG: YajG family lipoprotein [Gammaproteobacteria bacterium]|nr:YajG family lipoprotein [Gammaproteobacteria bacterium]